MQIKSLYIFFRVHYLNKLDFGIGFLEGGGGVMSYTKLNIMNS